MSEKLNFANWNVFRHLFCFFLVSGLVGACTKSQKETTDAGLRGTNAGTKRTPLGLEESTGEADFSGAKVECKPGQGVDTALRAATSRSSESPHFTSYRLAFVVPLDVPEFPLPPALSGALKRLSWGRVNLPDSVQLEGLLLDLNIVLDTRYQFWSESAQTCSTLIAGQNQKNCGGKYELPMQEIKIVGILAESQDLAKNGGPWSRYAKVPQEIRAALKAAKENAAMAPTAETTRRLMNQAIRDNSAPYVSLLAKPVFTLAPSPSLCQLKFEELTLSESRVVCSSFLPGDNAVQRAAEHLVAGFFQKFAIAKLNDDAAQKSIATNVVKAIQSYFGCGQAQL
jgi:hypothetical protein